MNKKIISVFLMVMVLITTVTAFAIVPVEDTENPALYVKSAEFNEQSGKLTIVVASTFTKAVGASGSTYTAEINIPADIGAKIYPYSGTTVASNYITAFKDLYSTQTILSYLVKITPTRLYTAISLSALTEDETYYIRQEITL